MSKASNPGPVGKRLKSLRKENGWTLAYITEKTGISQGTLSKLENGQTQLTFTTVNKLAQGLDLPISSLATPQGQKPDTARSLTRLGGGTVFESDDAHYEILCNDQGVPNQAYAIVTIMSHDAEKDSQWRKHPGKEFIYVLKGVLELHTEAHDPVELKTGDSIMFDASMYHKYASKSKEHAELLSTFDLAGYTDPIDTLDTLDTIDTL